MAMIDRWIDKHGSKIILLLLFRGLRFLDFDVGRCKPGIDRVRQTGLKSHCYGMPPGIPHERGHFTAGQALDAAQHP